MQISVIIPTYNRESLVCEAIDSVLEQTSPADEIIVVDDGSTDSTLFRLEAYQNQIKILQQPNRGISAARNLGIQHAQYDWLAFLDSDDLWKPTKLQRQRQALEQQPEFRICYTDEEWRWHGRWKNPKKIHRKYSGWIYEKCLPLCIISPSSVLMHKNVFDIVGLFDETLPACEDYDLWLRVSQRFPALFLPERLIVKRAGTWEQLSQQHSLDKFRIQALLKQLDSPFLTPSEKQQTRDMLAQKCHIYASGCRKHGRQDEAKWAEHILGSTRS